MLAARLYKVGEPMKLEQVPIPQPRPTDVLVKVRACGVVPNLINVLSHWQTWFPELPQWRSGLCHARPVLRLVSGLPRR
jgi:alcohol dehydrogenase